MAAVGEKRKLPEDLKKKERAVPKRRKFSDPSKYMARAREFRERIEFLGGRVVGEYQAMLLPVDCICKIGHECAPRPEHIKQGHGMCDTCCKIGFQNKCKNAEEEFYKWIIGLGGKVIGNYTFAKSKVECECPLGHICWPVPAYPRHRGMCHICAESLPNTAEEKFRNKVIKLGGRVIGPYISCNLGIDCACKNDHTINIRPDRLLNVNSLCRLCTHQDAENRFRQLVHEHGGKIVGKFTDWWQRIDCICLKGHECSPIPRSLKYKGTFCVKCKESKGETLLKNLFDKLEVKVAQQFQLPNPPSEWPKSRPFDFGNERELHEFDGTQHFKIVDHFGGKDQFDIQRERDIAKTGAAIKAGFKLIRYHFSFRELSEANQLEFIRRARASKSQLVVYRPAEYDWLKEFNPTNQ